MEKNEYNIETVEFSYNGDTEQFDKFLCAVIREYINEDKLSPDCEWFDKSS